MDNAPAVARLLPSRLRAEGQAVTRRTPLTAASSGTRVEIESSPSPRWPTADDLAMAEEPHYVLLSRVLHGLRRLPRTREQSDEPVTPPAPSIRTAA
jgi:hypothetical protein